MKRYAVVIEGGAGSYSAYVPDLPGCVAAADSLERVRTLIREAIALHIESLQAHGWPVPEPQAETELVEVEVACRVTAGASDAARGPTSARPEVLEGRTVGVRGSQGRKRSE